MYAEKFYARMAKLAESTPFPSTNKEGSGSTGLGTVSRAKPQSSTSAPTGSVSGLMRSSSMSKVEQDGALPVRAAGMEANNEPKSVKTATAIARSLEKVAQAEMGSVAGPALTQKIQKGLLGTSSKPPAAEAKPAQPGNPLGYNMFKRSKPTAKKSMGTALKGIKPSY